MGDDLKPLISGATGEAKTIKDKNGKEYHLCPLDLQDMVDFEDRTGHSILDVAERFRLKEVAYLLYLSIRKDGVSDADLDARKFAITEAMVMRSFDLRLLSGSAKAFLDIMTISGLTVLENAPTANPPAAPVEK